MTKSLDKNLKNLCGLSGMEDRMQCFDHELSCYHDETTYQFGTVSLSPKHKPINEINRLLFESSRFQRRRSVIGSPSKRNKQTIDELLQISLDKEDSDIETMILV